MKTTTRPVQNGPKQVGQKRHISSCRHFFSSGIRASTVKEDDPLALMGEQLLYIPMSSVTNMISIGEGNYKFNTNPQSTRSCIIVSIADRAIWSCVQGLAAHW